MNAEQEYDQLQEEWLEKIIRAYYKGIAALFVVEFIAGIFVEYYGIAKVRNFFEYSLFYTFLPSGLNLLFIFLTEKYVKNCKDKVKRQYATSFCLLFICTVIASVHSCFLEMPAVFAGPQVLTVTFNDKKLTKRIALLSVLFMVIAVGISPLFDDTWTIVERRTNALASIGFVFSTYVICSLYIDYANKKNELIKITAKSQDKLMESLRYDFLTGLYNHTEFYKQLETQVENCNSRGGSCTISILDIDNFKNVNDTYGHENGNKVLIKLAEIMQQVMEGFGTVSRYGGEEFGIISSSISKEKMETLSEKIRTKLEQEEFDFMKGEKITLSGGIAEYKRKCETTTEFFTRADNALYEAKEDGRNNIKMAK